MTPAQAREYIQHFRTHVLPGTDHVDTSAKRRIWLDNMSDADALFVAGEFARIEAEAAKGRKQRGMRDS